MFIENEAQVKLFLKEVFCNEDPNNSAAYDTKLLSTEEIFDIVKQYTSLFGERSKQSFSKWCSDNSVLFLMAKVDKNKKREKESIMYWIISIMVR